VKVSVILISKEVYGFMAARGLLRKMERCSMILGIQGLFEA
jgi:hypothetical protein